MQVDTYDDGRDSVYEPKYVIRIVEGSVSWDDPSHTDAFFTSLLSQSPSPHHLCIYYYATSSGQSFVAGDNGVWTAVGVPDVFGHGIRHFAVGVFRDDGSMFVLDPTIIQFLDQPNRFLICSCSAV
jgi:hypothetical protein